MASMRRPGKVELRFADAPAQLLVQVQRQLPRLQAAQLALRIVMAVVRRIEEVFQLVAARSNCLAWVWATLRQ